MLISNVNANGSPLTSSRSTLLFRRKGGGGGGGKGGSGSGRSGSGSASEPGSFGIPSGGKGTLSASPSSRGGGTPAAIPVGSSFAGRLSGGANRDQVYGNSRIGSGYPYGGYGTYYGGRPFPFGFYPVFITSGYYGGDEYGPNTNITRPGGPLSTAVVQTSASKSNASSPDSYYLVGDASSISAVLASLVSKCGVLNPTTDTTYINGTSNFNGSTLVPHPEQMVQYYRASSFALALSSYNNSAALLSRAPASNNSAAPPLSDDTPLPVGLNITLFTCLNTTIAANVPLLDVSKSGFSGLDIATMTLGILGAIINLFSVFWYYYGSRWYRNRRERR